MYIQSQKTNITKSSVHMFQVEVEDSLGKLGGVGSTLCQVSGTHPQNATNEKIQIQYPNTELYSKVGALLEF